MRPPPREEGRIIIIKCDCWAMVEVCTVPSALLVHVFRPLQLLIMFSFRRRTLQLSESSCAERRLCSGTTRTREDWRRRMTWTKSRETATKRSISSGLSCSNKVPLSLSLSLYVCVCTLTYRITRWLQLRFDFDLTLTRCAFDSLSAVIKCSVT